MPKTSVIATLLIFLFAACGGGQEATPTLAPTQPTATAVTGVAATPTPVVIAPTATPVSEEPQYGGILRTGAWTPRVATGEWGPVPTGIAGSTDGGLFSTLIGRDPYDNFKIWGDAIDRWEFSSDNSKLTLHVRPGMKWHDGTPVTADDVSATLQFNLDPPTGYTSTIGRRLLVPAIKSYIKVSTDTVEVQLNPLPASFLPRFASSSFQLLPAHLSVDETSKRAMGTGAFKLKGYERDISAELVRNPDYYLKDDKGRQLPYLDGIIRFQFNDQTLFLSALRTGRIRHTDNSNSAGIEKGRHVLRQDVPGLVTDEFFGGIFYFLFKNVPPFTDPRVLEAIDLWTDRKLYVDLGFDGLAWAWAFPPEIWGPGALEIMSRPGFRYLDASGKLVTNAEEAKAKWNELHKDPKDLERAQQLLRDAGIKQGDVKFEVLHTPVTATRTMPVFLAQMREFFGATWTGRFVNSPSTATADILQGRFSVYSTGGGATNAEPADGLTGWLWETSTNLRGSGWPQDDPRLVKIQELMDRQEFTFDEQKRQEIIDQLMFAVLDFRGTIFSNMSIGIITWWPEFRGYPDNIQSQIQEIQERYDRVWIAK